jgi:hypothetical protein
MKKSHSKNKTLFSPVVKVDLGNFENGSKGKRNVRGRQGIFSDDKALKGIYYAMRKAADRKGKTGYGLLTCYIGRKIAEAANWEYKDLIEISFDNDDFQILLEYTENISDGYCLGRTGSLPKTGKLNMYRVNFPLKIIWKHDCVKRLESIISSSVNGFYIDYDPFILKERNAVISKLYK